MPQAISCDSSASNSVKSSLSRADNRALNFLLSSASNSFIKGVISASASSGQLTPIKSSVFNAGTVITAKLSDSSKLLL